MPERINEGDITPTEKSSAEQSEHARDPEFETMKSLYGNAVIALEERAKTTTSPAERRWAGKTMREAKEMAWFFGKIEAGIKKGHELNWQEQLEKYANDDAWWDKKIAEIEEQGDDEKADKLRYRQEVIKKFSNFTSPGQVQRYFWGDWGVTLPKTQEASIVTTPRPEARDTRTEALVQEVYEQGRMAVEVSLSAKFAQTIGERSGFRKIGDRRSEGIFYARDIVPHIQTDFFERGAVPEILQQSDVNAAITIAPVESKVGTRHEKVLMGTYTGDRATTEQAYRLDYIVAGTDKKPYRDPDTGRHGNVFFGAIVLPGNIAKKVFSETQKNPRLAQEIFKRLNPELMADQKPYMPEVEKIFILPEGKSALAYEKNESGGVTAIKPEYIKNIE